MATVTKVCVWSIWILFLWETSVLVVCVFCCVYLLTFFPSFSLILLLLLLFFSYQVMSNSFAKPWTVACQAPLSMGFPRQKYWLPFPSPGDLLSPGVESRTGMEILYHWATWEAPSLLLPFIYLSLIAMLRSYPPQGSFMQSFFCCCSFFICPPQYMQIGPNSYVLHAFYHLS